MATLVCPMCRGPEGPGAIRMTTPFSVLGRSIITSFFSLLVFFSRSGLMLSVSVIMSSRSIPQSSAQISSAAAETSFERERSSGTSPITFPTTAFGFALPLCSAAFCNAYFLTISLKSADIEVSVERPYSYLLCMKAPQSLLSYIASRPLWHLEISWRR